MFLCFSVDISNDRIKQKEYRKAVKQREAPQLFVG